MDDDVEKAPQDRTQDKPPDLKKDIINGHARPRRAFPLMIPIELITSREAPCPQSGVDHETAWSFICRGLDGALWAGKNNDTTCENL